jgi:alpha/beta superfamily hydrolase
MSPKATPMNTPGTPMSRSSSEPLYFGAPGAEAFGWLHRPSATPARNIGLVICSPIGPSDHAAHRGLRQLAIEAAELAVPTLRFDFPANGDSAGEASECDHPTAWARAVHHAVDTLRARTGVARVCVVAPRLAALPGAQAASERDDVSAFIALAPVLRGRNFLRESMLRSGSVPVGTHADLEVAGYVLTARARAELAECDLLGLARPPAPRVLVVDTNGLHASDRWATHLAAQGARCDTRVEPSLIDMIEGAEDASLPHALISQLAAWVASGDRASAASTALAPAASDALGSPALQLDGVRETPLRFQIGETSLFSVLSEPAAGGAQRAVLLLNTGPARRVGPSRMHVTWARRWAREGVAVMRFDLPGLGDSEAHAGEREGEAYAITSAPAIAQALSELRARCGPVDCQVIGICSGAFHAYRAAVAGLPIRTLVLINQAAYRWGARSRLDRPSMAWRLAWVLKQRDTDGAGAPTHHAIKTLHRLKWHAIHAALVARAGLRAIAGAVGWRLHDDTGTELKALARRRVAVHVICADQDRGAALLNLEAPHAVKALRHSGDLMLETITEADHIFTSRQSRERLLLALDRIVHAPASVTPGPRKDGADSSLPSSAAVSMH